MFIKIFLIIAVMTYFSYSSNWKNAAIFWGVAILLLGFMFRGFEVGVLFNAVISFAIALGVFKLIDYLEGSRWYWFAYVGGIAALILVA